MRDPGGHGIAQPTVSKHLKILEGAGLVERSKEGLWVNYSVSNVERSPYAASLLGNLRHWLEDDREIRDLFVRSEGSGGRISAAPGSEAPSPHGAEIPRLPISSVERSIRDGR